MRRIFDHGTKLFRSITRFGGEHEEKRKSKPSGPQISKEHFDMIMGDIKRLDELQRQLAAYDEKGGSKNLLEREEIRKGIVAIQERQRRHRHRTPQAS